MNSMTQNTYKYLNEKEGQIDHQSHYEKKSKRIKKIDILLIVDSLTDNELLIQKLKQDGFKIESRCVETPEYFIECLHEKEWGLIISENASQNFNALQALEITRKNFPNLPFIIVSGTIGEENAINALKSGANDYVLKNNVKRLTPVIHHELIEYENNIQRMKMQEDLLKSQQNYQFLADNVQDLVSVYNNEGKCKWVSPSCKRILGFNYDDFIDKLPFSQVHPDDYDAVFNKIFKKILNGEIRGMQRYTYREMRKDGVYIYLETLTEPVYENNKLNKIVSTSRDITEQSLATQLLEENQIQLEIILESMTEGIVQVDENDVVKTFNQSAKEILQLTFDINSSFTKTFTSNYLLIDRSYNVINSDKLPHLLTLKSGVNTYNKVIGLKSKQKIKWLSINCVAFRLNLWQKGVVISFNDITESFNSKEKALQLASELVTLVETANAPIFGVNLTGKITEWNDYTAKITGYTLQEAIRNNFFEKLVTKPVYHEFNMLFKKLLNGGNLMHYELPILTKEGKIVTILFNGTIRRDYKNNIAGMVCVGQDITELIQYREQLEQKVEERTLKLSQALKKEKELVHLKSKFISMASHEFRTPLSTIQFASDFITKYHKKTEWEILQLKLNKINEQVAHMTNLLDDVLIMGKSEANQIKINLSALDINDFCVRTIEEVGYNTQNTHDIEFSVISDFEKIRIDEKLLKNITVNLLNNAIKFSPGQSKIRFEVICRKNLLSIKVQDNGLGIDKIEAELIFDAFHRSDSVNDIPGTGLGLSIVKKAVELQNGTITTESELGKGSTFTVKIPVIYEN